MPELEKLRLEISGAVQGVGFRPFVYRLAKELDLLGWVLNDGQGVRIEVEGTHERLEAFRRRVGNEAPPRAVIMSSSHAWLEAEGFTDFSIRHSAQKDSPTVVVLPDVATCGTCLAEIHQADDRRFRYPFTNCTDCGPRFSIVERLPYDRPHTTMRAFELCAECRAEYENPLDRRFHAQPNACPACGPQLAFVDQSGSLAAEGDAALSEAVAALRRGAIVALKGIGGFLLLLDAADEAAVMRLRRRKRRDEKPLAVMVPSLSAARRLAVLSELEESMLQSPEAPILIATRRADARLAPGIAPGNPTVGIMLPCSPLHDLICSAYGQPLVATSGNLSDEPISIDNDEALRRLRKVADGFLLHDRPIARHVDDSVVQVVAGSPQLLRRARGFAPIPVRFPGRLPTMVAVGAHLKNVAALSLGRHVFLSQHIGDMETLEAERAFDRVIEDFLELYAVRPECLVRDLHPDYATSRWAERVVGGGLEAAAGRLRGLPVVEVQHHHAHLASCLADNGSAGPALGVIWDGTGLGTDGTVWGGEFLVGAASSYRRLASLRPFALPGGDAAVKEPRRSALALAWGVWGKEALERAGPELTAAFTQAEQAPLARMLETGFRSPLTTSAGRLFDGVASLAGLRQRVAFEGQAAMLLEFAADQAETSAYPLPAVTRERVGTLAPDAPELELDWRELIEAVTVDSRRGREPGIIAARFHNALAEAIVAVADAAGERRVVLSGGCFQNRLLSERTSVQLEAAGFEVLRHRQVPANDGGLSLGQIAVAAHRIMSTSA